MAAITVLPDIASRSLSCSVCGGNPIAMPEDATSETTFTCKQCVAQISRDQNIEEMRQWSASERIQNAKLDVARKRYTEKQRAFVEVAKTLSQTRSQASSFQQPD